MNFNTLCKNVCNIGLHIASPSNLGRPAWWTVQYVNALKNWDSYCGLCTSGEETYNVEPWLLFRRDVDVMRLCQLKNYYMIFKFSRWGCDEPIYRSASFRLKTVKTLRIFSFLTKFRNHNMVLRLVILPKYFESLFKGLKLGYFQNPTLPSQLSESACLVRSYPSGGRPLQQ